MCHVNHAVASDIVDAFGKFPGSVLPTVKCVGVSERPQCELQSTDTDARGGVYLKHPSLRRVTGETRPTVAVTASGVHTDELIAAGSARIPI